MNLLGVDSLQTGALWICTPSLHLFIKLARAWRSAHACLYIPCTSPCVAYSLHCRMIATLQGGSVPQIGSQIFEFCEPSDIDVLFTFLKHDTEYGKLRVREEPLMSGYTSMGRHVSGISIEKCYFGNFCHATLCVQKVKKKNVFIRSSPFWRWL